MISSMDALREAKELVIASKYPNVRAVGIGYKTIKGKKTKDLAVIVFVKRKLTNGQLGIQAVVPKVLSVNNVNVQTDVVESGEFKSLSYTDKVRPLVPSHSVGHFNITAGTIGCFVQKNEKLCILSNNHVLANVNKANIGDLILQPGKHDGGTLSDDVVARLTDYEPIDMLLSQCGFSKLVAGTLNAIWKSFGKKTRFVAQVELSALTNLVDCAIAEVYPEIGVNLDVPMIGYPTGLKEAQLGMKIRKSGRTTGYTEGEITAIEMTITVNMGDDFAIFTDQIATTEISAPGDSGSAVFDEGTNLVGLLFAGGSGVTVCNRIQNVFTALDVKLP